MMSTFIFFAAALFLLFFYNVNAFDEPACNVSLEASETEIHAVLARDRYINFTGWTPNRTEITGKGAESISYGYLREMILHLTSVSDDGKNGNINARVFLTALGYKTFVYEISNCKPDGSCPKLLERFLKFKLFDGGIKIDQIDVLQTGMRNTESSCTKQRSGIPQSDGLLIEIDCKTTDVKKILVKCVPK
uniref:Uncharacterized protein n=1 Tax=Panagrolaimus sp. ES5 TaxID=591445 RepID=A0AC34GPE9_9BILA